MLKISLIALFVMAMATLTVAASSLPVPPNGLATDVAPNFYPA